MRVIHRTEGQKGCTVELNRGERIIKEIHDRMMDLGLSQWEAAQIILGGGEPIQGTPAPTVDAIFDADPDFLIWLVQ